jgi:argininosuccinate lyase
MKGLPLAYNRDLQEDKIPLFDTVDTVKTSVQIMAEVIHGMKVRKDRMLTAAQDGFMNATDLADYLVERGVPFRDAHTISVGSFDTVSRCRIRAFIEDLQAFQKSRKRL